MAQPRPLFVYFGSFETFKHQFHRIIVGFSGIRTRIVKVEAEHAEHLTTTAAQDRWALSHRLGNSNCNFIW